MARRDSQSHEEQEVSAPDFNPSTPEEKEAAKLLAEMKEDKSTKKNNIKSIQKICCGTGSDSRCFREDYGS